MSGSNILDVLSHPAAADPSVYTKGIEGLNALRDTQAKQASADAYRQATDPATGQVDMPTYNRLISQGPGAWNAGELMRQQGVAQAAQGQGVQEQLTAHRSRMAFMLGQMNDLLAKNQPIHAGDIATALNNAHFSPSEAAQITQMVNGASGGDPNFDYTGFVKNQVTANLAAKDQIDRVTPKIEFQQTPQGLVAVDTNPNTTKTGPGWAIPSGLPPGTPTMIKGTDANGNVTYTPGYLGGAVRPGTMIPPGGQGGGGGGGGSGGAANNPLNMRFAGQEGATNSGGFAAFKTPEAGQAATDALFSKYADSGVNTLTGLISKWAPPSENDTPGYIVRVAKATGIDPNAPINLKDPAVARKIQQAMAVVEGNKNASVAPAPTPAASTPPPAAPAGPPGVQMGGAPPPPPGGAAGPYTGGGIGAALAPGGGANPIVVRGTPLPAGRLSGYVGAMVQGMQLARANPLQMGSGAMVTGPGAPSGNALAGPSVEPPPQPGWGSAVGSYGGGLGAATPTARPATPAAPVAAPAATAQPTAAAPPPAPYGAPGTVLSGAPIGYEEAIKTAARGSAEDQMNFRRDLPAAQGRIFTAQQALEALKGAKTGGGTGWLQSINAILSSYDPGIFKALTGGTYDPAELATNRDLAEKYLTQIAMGNASRIGPGTDAKLAAAFTGNPNTHITNLAATDVLKVQIGLDRMQQAMGDDMQRQNVAPQDFASWRQNWARTHDPRAFVLDSMSPEQLASLKETMKNASPQEKSIFRKSVEEAHGAGHVNLTIPGQ